METICSPVELSITTLSKASLPMFSQTASGSLRCWGLAVTFQEIEDILLGDSLCHGVRGREHRGNHENKCADKLSGVHTYFFSRSAVHNRSTQQSDAAKTAYVN